VGRGLSKRLARSNLILATAQKDAARVRRQGRPAARRVALLVQRRALPLAIIVQVAVAAVAVGVGLVLQPRIWSSLAPVSPDDALIALWQVHLGFVSIAFAGLAVLLQLAAEPVITARSLRADLFRHTFFVAILFQALAGAIQLGVVALWFDSSSALVIEFFLVVAVTVAAVAFAYLRATALFTNPALAVELGKKALREELLDSIYADAARTKANELLHDAIPRAWRVSYRHAKDVQLLVRFPGACVVRDVDLRPLLDVQVELDRASTAVAHSHPWKDSGSAASDAGSAQKPLLRILVGVGESVAAGEACFALEQSAVVSHSLASIENRLRAALVTEAL
jgi:hypothetical protein